ncbi:hypothetical protein Pmani_018479 [Petrolisthes manimaculis]|uniref:HTTM-like domain-containing protein n=1 Tax=Petrolisthes manimaculis TaxID=1843537 RepID=A0AAE1PLG8_9EUCA|nr:hypothetical protein Pmani_018479 [Petrolisthes manimaculis]
MKSKGSTAETEHLTVDSSATSVMSQEPTIEDQDSSMELQKLKRKPQDIKHESSNPSEKRQSSSMVMRGLDSLAVLLHQPCDPASLAVTRIAFGLLMMLDIPHERGMSKADIKWNTEITCQFPLFQGLTPLPINYMIMLYALMVFCAASIAVGWKWRTSCGIFVICYWYHFLLDTSTWNNHSYLYGLLATILLFSDAHKCWSLDVGLSNKAASHVPLWTYILLRVQIFLLYFLAGIKKLDPDWVGGYSMSRISHHWLFAPFRLLVGREWVNKYLVHIGGLLLDLTIGPLLLHPTSRPYAFIPVSAFHLLNSMIFSIGMFPWVCLATLPLFCNFDWPRSLFNSITSTNNTSPSTLATNPGCIYSGDKKVTRRQRGRTMLMMAYILLQLVLPFSHSITKGYNTWTNGLYGYSWDMMVYSMKSLHTRVTVIESNGNKQYIDPYIWTLRQRWTSHANMALLYGKCVQERLAAQGTNISAVHLDVWKSLNGRFQQRVYDPTVNILTAPWSPWTKPAWVLPVVTERKWQQQVTHLQRQAALISPFTERFFFADYPGLTMQTYLRNDLEGVVIEVLKGTILVSEPHDTSTKVNSRNFVTTLHTWKKSCSGVDDEFTAQESVWQDDSTCVSPMAWMKEAHHSLSLGPKDRVILRTGVFYDVTTTSPDPAFYMVTFTNSTQKKTKLFERQDLKTQTETVEGVGSSLEKLMADINKEWQHFPTLLDYCKFIEHKVMTYYRSAQLFYRALFCIFSNTCMLTL